jgi:hypothetical protein
MDEHKEYIESLCRKHEPSMIHVYRQELSYLNGEVDYEDAESRHVISMSSIPVIGVDGIHEILANLGTKFKQVETGVVEFEDNYIGIEQVREILANLEAKFRVKSEMVEYEDNYINFKSPLIRAWVTLHLKTNPKERGK